MSPPRISLYLHGCLTHRAPPHSITPHASRFSPYFLKKKKNSSKLRQKLLQSETTLMSSLQSANLTATIVWAKFSYCYLTTAHGMLHVDDRLPFSCKFTTNCNAKRYRRAYVHTARCIITLNSDSVSHENLRVCFTVLPLWEAEVF